MRSLEVVRFSVQYFIPYTLRPFYAPQYTLFMARLALALSSFGTSGGYSCPILCSDLHRITIIAEPPPRPLTCSQGPFCHPPCGHAAVSHSGPWPPVHTLSLPTRPRVATQTSAAAGGPVLAGSQRRWPAGRCRQLPSANGHGCSCGKRRRRAAAPPTGTRYVSLSAPGGNGEVTRLVRGFSVFKRIGRLQEVRSKSQDGALYFCRLWTGIWSFRPLS